MSVGDVGVIGLVKKYPLLYDITSPLYLDQHQKDEAWNEIATIAGLTPYECKTKWTRLRENYRKAIILRKKNDGKSKDRPVKYEKEMSFLNANFSVRNNLRKPGLEWVPEPHINMPPVESRSVEPNSTKIPAEIKKTEINVFFEGIAETVKTLPKKVQVQLKREIFNIVNDAEASVLSREDNPSEMMITAWDDESPIEKEEIEGTDSFYVKVELDENNEEVI